MVVNRYFISPSVKNYLSGDVVSLYIVGSIWAYDVCFVTKLVGLYPFGLINAREGGGFLQYRDRWILPFATQKCLLV